jgi:aspartyl-tRNA synthetase
VTVADDGTLGGPVAKNLSDAERAGLVEAVGAKPGDCVFFAAGPRRSAQELLGAARNEIAKRLELIEPGSWSFLFVVDFPMFEETEDGSWTFMHHPFTSPTPEFRESFADHKGEALSDAYDMVINGNEVMSGSVRIHDAGLQERVFETLGMSREEARERFGFFLEAFAYGPPPHAGAALGWDRLTALLTGVESIREVIAFPKTGAGYDPLTGAPTPITEAQRKEAGIDAKPEEPPLPGQPGAPGPTDPTS